jgi:hypothetical protein
MSLYNPNARSVSGITVGNSWLRNNPDLAYPDDHDNMSDKELEEALRVPEFIDFGETPKKTKFGNGIISKSEIIHLRQPCKNREVELVDNDNGTVTVNGHTFERGIDVSDFLESIPRKDI